MKFTVGRLCLISLVLALLLLPSSSLYSATTPTGLIGHWSFDEGAGTIAADSSGVGNHAILVNDASWTAGKFGSALSLNGTADFADLGNPPVLRPSSLTVSAWIKTSNGGMIFRSFGSGFGLQLGYGDNFGATGKISFWTWGTQKTGVTSSQSYNDGQWHLVTGTFDISTVSLFVDGTFVGSTPGNLMYQTARLTIGSDGGVENYFKGLIDDVEVYNRSLTASEIQALYTNGPTQPPKPIPVDIPNPTPTPTPAPPVLSTSILSNGVGWADSWNGVHSFLVFAPIGAFPEPFLTSIASRYDFGWSATSGGALQEGNSKFIYGTYYSATQGHHNFEWYLENHPDWILYGCDRASPMLQYSYSAVILDFTNPEVIDYKFDELVNGTAVAWDNFLLGNDITLPDGTTGHACGVYDQTGNWIQKFAGIGSYSEVKDPQWTDGMIAYASAIRQRLHDLPNPKLLIPNADVKVITGDPIRVANFIAAVDGVLVEGGQFGPSSLGDERLLWLRNIRLAEAMNNAGKAFYSLEYADWATSKGKTIVKDYIQFTLASYLLAKGHATAIDILPTLNYDDSDGIYWPAEFQAATEIGTPCAAMAQIGGIDGSEEGVFFREHSGGVSLVNSSRINWYVVDLSTTKSSYKDLYGNAVASLVVVRPISGLVLLKANEDGCSNSR